MKKLKEIFLTIFGFPVYQNWKIKKKIAFWALAVLFYPLYITFGLVFYTIEYSTDFLEGRLYLFVILWLILFLNIQALEMVGKFHEKYIKEKLELIK